MTTTKTTSSTTSSTTTTTTMTTTIDYSDGVNERSRRPHLTRAPGGRLRRLGPAQRV